MGEVLALILGFLKGLLTSPATMIEFLKVLASIFKSAPSNIAAKLSGTKQETRPTETLASEEGDVGIPTSEKAAVGRAPETLKL